MNQRVPQKPGTLKRAPSKASKKILAATALGTVAHGATIPLPAAMLETS